MIQHPLSSLFRAMSEEVTVLLFRLRHGPLFRLSFIVCLAVGAVTPFLNLHKLAELSAAVIFSLLGAVVVAVTFLATIMNERFAEKKQHYHRIMLHLGAEKTALNAAMQQYFAQTTPPEQEWEYASILQLYILLNVQQATDVAILQELLNAFKPANAWLQQQFADTQTLLRHTYADYIWIARQGLQVLQKRLDMSPNVSESLQKLGETLSRPAPGSLQTILQLREMLGRRIVRVIAYSSLGVLVALVVASSNPMTLWAALPTAAIWAIKGLFVAFLLGVILLTFRYLLLLAQFIHDSFQRDDITTPDGMLG